MFISFCYLLFFLSGAAALIYQVAWVRSLTLIFGGTHLAVTTVLSVFMAGLALGGYVIGRYADSVKKPLKLYGYLELGIALSALIFIALMKLYAPIYVFLVQIKDDSQLYIFLIRFVFSAAALIIPTTLMGGTLPLMTKFLSRQPDRIRGRLSYLYALNTFGAVMGTLLAGFYILKYYSVSSALYTAISINTLVGIAAVVLQSKMSIVMAYESSRESQNDSEGVEISDGASSQKDMKFEKDTDKSITVGMSSEFVLPMKLVLWGIGVSGFCALAYEVLWTRVLSIIFGASVFSFTIVLAAFLSGIAVGSEFYGILPKIFGEKKRGIRSSIVRFGIVQIVIGLASLAVSSYVIYLPSSIVQLEAFFSQMGMDIFGVRAWASFSLAFLFMFIPAFFMGVAFPLVGKAHAEYKRRVGSAVGEVLAYNTIGAILGAATSGFLLMYFLGIERSLEIITAINVGLGLLVLASLRNSKVLNLSALGLGVFLTLFLIIDRDNLRIWDTNYFAIYQSIYPEDFDSKEKIQSRLDRVDILYYAEGVESIVSSIKVDGNIMFLTNGRVEASTHLLDLQTQLALGHVPMLLNKDPKDVLVIGTGSGMTLGATSLYPSVEQITLAEIEPKVIGVAKTFEKYNHHVLDNPKLKIIFNDGRNYLMTSKQKYDVITADPIHPWFRGAGYLYTKEYFDIAAQHLKPGGIVCQWLPLYELTTDNIKSVVKTFASSFKYTMMWLTFDAELIGSNSPIILDKAAIRKKMTDPVINADLQRTGMGSVGSFLSYFVMGPKRMSEFGRDGILNTDDNLYLEFSAPLSFGKPHSEGWIRNEIMKNRENVYQYLVPEKGP
jgi:spermidine synthase